MTAAPRLPLASTMWRQASSSPRQLAQAVWTLRPDTPAGAATLYIKRHLDVLMVANSEFILEQSQRLIDGNRDEEPFGRVAAYADGAVARIEEWADDNAIDEPNVVEYMFEPNAFDAFLRFASVWPNPAAEDSMNERVLASFLNLKGWLKVTGGLMFDGTPGEEALCAT